MKIKINEKKLAKLVQPALKDIAKQYDRDFASLSRSHKGKPVEEIKPRIKSIFKKHGGSIDDKELTEYAQKISEGTQIKFHA